MTDAPQPSPKPAEAIPSVAARLAFYQRASGIVTPLLTAVLAFFIGGLVVLVTTHKDPLNTYKEIFNGTGLNWLSPVSIHWHSFHPSAIHWTGYDTGNVAGQNLQQTLI